MKVTFRCPPELEDLLLRPVLANAALPAWLKTMPSTAAVPGFDAEIRTLKHCPPLLDAMRTGFLMPLAADIEVQDGRFAWDWELPGKILGGVTRSPLGFHHGEQATGSPLFDPEQLFVKFNNFWTIGLPEGWSLLVCHPVNRLDLPFRTLTGLVDADLYQDGLIHFPALWVDRSFEGKLARGTPIAQCIPVPREALELHCEPLSGAAAARFTEVKEAVGAEPGVYRKRFRASRS
ncbi:MAG: hypothetical protein OET79_07455 [Nitrospirota bacterium]|nr:hypothetical protein [Nitrospirota bacterium]